MRKLHLCRAWKYSMLVKRVVTKVRWMRLHKGKVLFVACVLLIGYMHVYLVPGYMSYYDKPCYLSPGELGDMEFLLARVTDAYNKCNVTYWLDYGTLLGVWKTGGVLEYDGDLDVVRLFDDIETDMRKLSRLVPMLHKHNITIDGFTAKFNRISADLFRSKIHENRTLSHWYPFTENHGVVANIYYYFFPRDVPYDVIFPTRTLHVYGIAMSIPNKPLNLIKRRYPFTWFMSVPYKWRCWISV